MTDQRTYFADERRERFDEWLILAHVAVLIAFVTWAYGGGIGWARDLATVWSLGGGLLIVARKIHAAGPRAKVVAHQWDVFHWPILAYAGVTIAALMNPTFHETTVEGDTVLAPRQLLSMLPTSANPMAAARELALFVGIVVSAGNLVLWVNRSQLLRALLGFIALNSVLLAIFGTLQKLGGTQMFFGETISPNPAFFATFIYHNHWSAFALLGITACGALLFNRVGESEENVNDLTRSPAIVGIVAIFLLLATLPLSTSRSGTALGVILGVPLAVVGIRRLRKHGTLARRMSVLVLILSVVGGLTAIFYLAKPIFEPRVTQTRQELLATGDIGWRAVGDRPALYRDTWKMAAEKPWFGWGTESYEIVFPMFQSEEIGGVRYAHAHSDWLQSLAEAGWIGTILTALMSLKFVRLVSQRRVATLSRWLFFGCALIVIYSALEFPFANAAVQICFWIILAIAGRYTELVSKRPRAA